MPTWATPRPTFPCPATGSPSGPTPIPRTVRNDGGAAPGAWPGLAKPALRVIVPHTECRAVPQAPPGKSHPLHLRPPSPPAVSTSAASTRESVAVEDYLEKIHELIDAKGYARVADIAESFGIARPSVSNMVRRLDEKGLVKHEKYRGMTLTTEGERLARRIAERHGILSEFLDLLGLDAETAYRDVEGMEHHISTQTLRGIEQIIAELKADAPLRARVRAAALGKTA
ncbi:MAG: MarR family transcriptional regulator [Verrucomicrobiales bacterium]|nr:MarR family transcriptional regulator [Verrucomicrobiales bacterium]